MNDDNRLTAYERARKELKYIRNAVYGQHIQKDTKETKKQRMEDPTLGVFL